MVGGSATGSIDRRRPGLVRGRQPGGRRYRIDLEGSPTGGGTLTNPVSARDLRCEYGDRIDGTTDDDGGEGRNSRLTFTPDEGATYYVSAGDYGNHSFFSVGTYTLSVEEVDAM